MNQINRVNTVCQRGSLAVAILNERTVALTKTIASEAGGVAQTMILDLDEVRMALVLLEAARDELRHGRREGQP